MTTNKRRVSIGAAGMCLIALLGVSEPAAAQHTKPVEIALWEGLQIQRPDADIAGLRLGIYGVNRSMSGIDVAVVGRTTEHQEGVFFGFVGITEGDFSGWQAAQFGNIARGRLSGAQTGLYNEAGSGTVGSGGTPEPGDR